MTTTPRHLLPFTINTREKLLSVSVGGEILLVPLETGLEAIQAALNASNGQATEDRTAPRRWLDLCPFGVAVSVRGTTQRMVLIEPPKERPIRYEGRDQVETWRLPHLLWVLDYQLTGQHMSSALFMLERAPATILDSVNVYSFPHGNVYQGGKICWGEVRVHGPATIPNAFFGSTFNGDLTFWPGATATMDAINRERDRRYVAGERHADLSNWTIWQDLHPGSPLPFGRLRGNFAQIIGLDITQ
jgi:hypothetical protein